MGSGTKEGRMDVGLLHQDLDGRFCTDCYYRHPMMPKLLYTSGVQFLVKNGCCYWLLDVIMSYQPKLLKKERLRRFQFWTVTRVGERGGLVECREDSGMKPVVSQKLEYCDFPFRSGSEAFDLWVEPTSVGEDELAWVILLPREH